MRIRPRPGGNLVGVKGASTDPTGTKRLPPLATVLDAFAQMLIVGTGISQGREPAPRQYAAVAAQALARRFRVDVATRGLLIAATAGAGLASVYNVPLAGALYALEEVVRPNLRTRRGWWQVAVAVIISALSTAVSWLFNHRARTYVMPQVRVDVHAYAWAALIAVVALVVGFAFQRALAWIKAHGSQHPAAVVDGADRGRGGGGHRPVESPDPRQRPGARADRADGWSAARRPADRLRRQVRRHPAELRRRVERWRADAVAGGGCVPHDGADGLVPCGRRGGRDGGGGGRRLRADAHPTLPMFSAMFALELTGSGLFTSSAVAWGVGLTWALYLLLPRLARRLRRRGPGTTGA